MAYIKGENRHQTILFPDCIDDYVEEDSPARLFDAFVNRMEELDTCDESDNRKLSREELQHKLEVCQDRKAKYEGYRQHLEESGEKQISTTDPDSRLMKQNEGFGVCYNVQTSVDAERHMVAGFKVTNCPTDHGQIAGLASEVKADYGVDILEATADKGYECPEDI